MKLFMLKSIIVVAIMFICVLAGIQLANDGIHKMKGYSDPDFKSALTLTEKNNKMEATILGSDLSSHDLKAKKDKLEKMNAYNLFSAVGKKMSDGISNTSEKILNSIAN
jgi:hypothetical protein